MRLSGAANERTPLQLRAVVRRGSLAKAWLMAHLKPLVLTSRSVYSTFGPMWLSKMRR